MRSILLSICVGNAVDTTGFDGESPRELLQAGLQRANFPDDTLLFLGFFYWQVVTFQFPVACRLNRAFDGLLRVHDGGIG